MCVQRRYKKSTGQEDFSGNFPEQFFALAESVHLLQEENIFQFERNKGTDISWDNSGSILAIATRCSWRSPHPARDSIKTSFAQEATVKLRRSLRYLTRSRT